MINYEFEFMSKTPLYKVKAKAKAKAKVIENQVYDYVVAAWCGYISYPAPNQCYVFGFQYLLFD